MTSRASVSAIEPRVSMAGDTAIVVTLGDSIDPAVSRRVLALGRRIMAERQPGVIEAVPGLAALTIHFDPDLVDPEALAAQLSALVREDPSAAEDARPSPRRWLVPVCYDRDLGPDLDEVASRSGLPVEEIVARHSGTDYHVYMLGFLPGFPYMGDLDRELRLPRRPSPRLAVPAGSVAIAAAMTAIYPLQSPGGWHVIGRTPVRLFDVDADPPALIAPGDSVRFRPITRSELERLAAHSASGRPGLEPVPAGGGALA